MSFRKYQKAEKVEPVSSQGNETIREYVHGLGKRSASQLTDKEREGLPQEDS